MQQRAETAMVKGTSCFDYLVSPAQTNAVNALCKSVNLGSQKWIIIQVMTKKQKKALKAAW